MSVPTPSSPAPSAVASEHDALQPLAGLIAVVFPGLGHLYLGHIRRGILVMVGVLGLFVSGLGLGGIDCVDRREDGIWFLGQMLVGPVAFGVDAIHQSHFKVIDPVRARVRDDQMPGPEAAVFRRTALPTEFRHPQSGVAIPISVDSSGKSSATYLDLSTRQRVTVSPAYPPNQKSLGRMNELGTLFTTMAGFLNLIAVLDALWRIRVQKKVVATNVQRTLKVPA